MGELHGGEHAGKSVALDDVPEGGPAAGAPLKIPVRLLTDDADRRTRPVWEAALRKRFDEAAKVVAAHAPIRFEVTEVGEWNSAPTGDLDTVYAGFVKAVKPDPSKLAVGY